MNKSLIILFSITLWLCCPEESYSESRLDQSDEFQTEQQPYISKMFYWDGRIIAQTRSVFFGIDPSAGSSTPMYAPANRRLLSLTTAFGKPYALCGGGDISRHLYYRSKSNDWDMLDVPKDEEGNEDIYDVMAGNDTALVLFGRKGFMVYNGTKWEQHAYSWNIELKPDVPNPDNLPPEVLKNFREFYPSNEGASALWGGQFYYSYDKGEFGGGLYRLDLTTGEWCDAVDNESICHVRDLCITPENQLMIIQGYSHLGLTYLGTIYRLTKDGLSTELSITNPQSSDVQWPYDSKLFLSVEFNGKKEPILLTPRHGLFVRRGVSWEQLTPFWSKSAYPTCFLILNENEYLIGTYEHGVIQIDRTEKSEKAIQLATYFYDWPEIQSNQHVDLTPDGAGHM